MATIPASFHRPADAFRRLAAAAGERSYPAADRSVNRGEIATVRALISLR